MNISVAAVLAALAFSSLTQTGMSLDATTVQLCWAFGLRDDAVYFAEIEERDDRQQSFTDLMDISGIDRGAVQCITHNVHDKTRATLIGRWERFGFEVNDTNFLSDLE